MALDLSNAKIKRGKISESDRSFDYDFWREQPAIVKLAAIWEMTVFQHMASNLDANELRLDRTVGGFRKKTTLDISLSAVTPSVSKRNRGIRRIAIFGSRLTHKMQKQYMQH